MPSSRARDHISNRNFKVEIEGVTSAAFSECAGLEVEIEVVEIRDGDDRLRKRPGDIHYSNIVLKRGYTGSSELWNWIKNVLDGNINRRSGSIILLGDDMETERVRYNFFEAWPCRWKGLELDASGLGASIEELEIAVEHLELA